MNQGKICISVSASSAEEFIAAAGSAAASAPNIELRFDSLAPAQLPLVWPDLLALRRSYNGRIIATYRSSENGQGGLREIGKSQREDFWRLPNVRAIADWADVEEDVADECLLDRDRSAFNRVIRSFHRFRTAISDSEAASTVRRLRETGSKLPDPLPKLAAECPDVTDSIPIWKVIEDAQDGDVPIAIAMGEMGTWTRILGPAYGVPVSYASIDERNKSAPGQFSATELREIYRVDELDRSTSVFGICGFPARQSMSPYIHNPAFKAKGLNAVYVPLPARDLPEFFKRMVSPSTREIGWSLRGLSITHPHKQTVIPLLDSVDERAAAIGAVNTVKIADGKMTGFNTDSEGFLRSLTARSGDTKGSSVGIIGTGGAALAAAHALVDAGADVTLFSRDGSTSELQGGSRNFPVKHLTSEIECFEGIDILINATPQGSGGALINETPALSAQMRNLQLVFDMVYNPKMTRFLSEAETAGIPAVGGIEMLIEQAILQFRIWTGFDAPSEVMRETVYGIL